MLNARRHTFLIECGHVGGTSASVRVWLSDWAGCACVVHCLVSPFRIYLKIKLRQVALNFQHLLSAHRQARHGSQLSSARPGQARPGWGQRVETATTRTTGGNKNCVRPNGGSVGWLVGWLALFVVGHWTKTKAKQRIKRLK